MDLQLNRRQLLTVGTTLPILTLFPGITYADIIRELRGQAWVNDKVADLKTPIKMGDVVRTGKNSRIIFVIEDDAYKLGPYSSLRLEPKNGTKTTLNLLTGSLLGVFGKGEPKTINTKGTTIGIRGTGLYVQVNEDHTYFCTCYGHTVTTSLASGETQEMKQDYHHAVTIKHDNKEKAIEKAGLYYHQDEDLVYLESFVGREPPARFKA